MNYSADEILLQEEDGTLPSPQERDVGTDADIIFLESIKKKNEERKKALTTISMSYDKLGCDGNLIQNGHAQSENRTEDILASKCSKAQRLNEAIMSLDYAAVSKLLEQGAGVNIPSRFGRFPLHNAILKGDHRMVKMILEAGAHVTQKDDRGDTPLHYAIRTGNEDIIKDLLEYSECDVNAEGINGSTPLHVAASLNKHKICKILLEHMARLDNRDMFGKTPLGKAMESGASRAAKYLLGFITQNNMDVQLYLHDADEEGSTLLHLAVDSGFPKVVKLCLQYGSVIRQPKAKDRSTAFHLACEQGSVEIAKLLLQHDPGIARIFLIDTNGATPLHNAAKNNSHALMELLLEHGANVNAKDGNNVTPIMLAASFGATDTVQLLLEKGADPTIKNIDGRSVIFSAVGHSDIMKILLTDGENSENLITLLTENDATGFAPPHYAAKHGDLKSMQLFLECNKATAAVSSDSLDTPLHVAARHGKQQVVNLLLEKQATKIINLQDTRGRTALHYAAGAGYHRVAAKLLSCGASIEKDQNDRTALHEAARTGSKRTVELIVNARSHCLNFVDDEKNTALHLAAMYEHAELVTFLLSQSTQKVLLNSSNKTILTTALETNNHEVTEAIVEHSRWKEIFMASNTDLSKQMMTIIEKMPHLAERLLDHCAQTEGNPFGRDYKIKYDLSLILGKDFSGAGNSLKVLKCMVENRRDRCLTHPLCFIVLSTKWKRFGCPIFLINLLLFLLLLVPLTYLHVLLEDTDDIYCSQRLNYTKDGEVVFDLNDTTCFIKYPGIQAAQYVIIIFGAIQIIKEIVQVYYQRMRYFASVSSWLDIIGVVTALFSVIPPCECKWGLQKEFAAFAIFLCWINLILYFRRLPFYGKYVIMLYCMFTTLLKVLVLFMFFVIAFASTFHIIMDKDPFTSMPNILMNVFIMTLGEMNYTDVFMPWSELYYPYIVNALMVMFCLTMPIIMMNMLVGLAVGDIDKIERNALIDRYIMQVELLIDLENALPSWLLKRFHLSHVIDYPNKDRSILTKIFDALVGFGTGHDEDAENNSDRNEMPEIAKIQEKLEDHAAEMEEIHKTVTTILDLLRSQEEAAKIAKAEKDEKSSTAGGIPGLDFLGMKRPAFFGIMKADEETNQDIKIDK